MKSTTIYKVKLILIVYFLFSEKAKFCGTDFRRCEKIIYLVAQNFAYFKKKRYIYKINCSL